VTEEQIYKLLDSAPLEVVVDTEHLPNTSPGLSALLGISLCWPGQEQGYYISLNHWVGTPSTRLEPVASSSLVDRLRIFLTSRNLAGWNVEHDREWLDASFDILTCWTIDGRIMWYLTDRVQKERGYALKRAQTTVLGWPEAADSELRAAVASAGGSVDKGDHYLAPASVLGRYAAVDAYSTMLVIEDRRPELANDNGWASHNTNRDYAALLASTTRRGVEVNEQALLKAKRHYEAEVLLATQRIRQVCADEISVLEASFLTKRLQGYKTETGASAFLAAPARHPRFNPNSSDQRSMLLHDVVGLPVVARTKTGKPKSDKNTIAAFDHPSAQAFVTLSKNEKLLQFTEQYLEHVDNKGLIHFPHDTCATVSERLGGYAPYDLNMPFSSEPIMRAFRVRSGYVGIHMDLVSIEPCLIAGFSGDETMLKVYRDGLGDIYLDLCLDLFPLEEAGEYDVEIERPIREFHSEYRTDKPPSSEQKEQFNKIRKVAKIIQLAVGYTGNKYTVSKNLTMAGFPTPLWRAGTMVERYWERFAKVARLAAQLKSLAEQRGYINGFYGRKLYIPKSQTKDALNRFGQFGGHAVLRQIVFQIAERSAEVGMHPLLIDIHDSTSWEVPIENYEKGLAIFEGAVRDVNTALALPVHVRGEFKRFDTLFGLKNRE
jgi:DNA polymerase I-like protein with 3'-5' exonuclease and polymerase domains